MAKWFENVETRWLGDRQQYYWCPCCKDYAYEIIKIGYRRRSVQLVWDGYGYAYQPNPDDPKDLTEGWYCSWCYFACDCGCTGKLKFDRKAYRQGRGKKREE